MSWSGSARPRRDRAEQLGQVDELALTHCRVWHELRTVRRQRRATLPPTTRCRQVATDVPSSRGGLPLLDVCLGAARPPLGLRNMRVAQLSRSSAPTQETHSLIGRTVSRKPI